MVYLALGIGPVDEVICPGFGFLAENVDGDTLFEVCCKWMETPVSTKYRGVFPIRYSLRREPYRRASSTVSICTHG